MRTGVGLLAAVLLRGATALASSASADGLLEAGFVTPPASAKPHTWYHMMNGNVSKAGITRDFEALAEAGFGGVQMFDVGCNIPAGDVAFNTPEWFDLLCHADREAKRLGLEICIPNCSGWSSSGGPWNPPSNGMKRVVISETRLKGPRRFDGTLPRERDDHGYYEDIAILAFPVPLAERTALPAPARLESALTLPADAYERLSDGKTDSVLELKREDVAKNSITFAYDAPVAAAGVECQFVGGSLQADDVTVTVEGSADGTAYERIAVKELALSRICRRDETIRFVPFERVAPFVKLRVSFVFNPNRKCAPFALGELTPVTRRRLTDVTAKTFAARLPIDEDRIPARPDQVVPRGSVRLVAAKADGDRVVWDVPEGDWTLLRVGAVCSGQENHPASAKGRGLEVDKLSAAAMDYHFEQYVAHLCRETGLASARTAGLCNILVDSYEVGSQNWTQALAREFRCRRGYDLTPCLPTFAGFVVGSVAESERFLEDFRRVVADLFAENYAGALAKKCHQYGLKCSVEPYGNGPSDDLQYGQYVDIPMCEFWSSAADPYHAGDGNATAVSFVSHVWGKPICGAEAFTAGAGEKSGRWQTTPFSIKAQGDLAFSDGVNRLIYHRFTHQPWADDRYLPGMTMGPWGMHLDRTQTWWPLARPFFRYQARCQYLLQRGTFVADVLFFEGEQAPGCSAQPGTMAKDGFPFVSVPAGYKCDVCPTDAMHALRVEEGEVVVPGGVRYRLLVLPSVEAMSTKMLKTIRRLQSAGAKLVWTQKPVRALGLSEGMAGDAAVRKLAEEIFAAGVINTTVADALKTLGVAPQVVAKNLPKDVRCLNWIQRREGDARWFFVAQPTHESCETEISFRVSGFVPEIWDAESGEMKEAADWRVVDGRTIVRVPFTVCGSKFVVFRKRTEKKVEKRGGGGERRVISSSEINGPWVVTFPAGFRPNALAKGPDETVTFDSLVSWSERPEEGVKYFSGRAVYHKTVPVPPLPKGVRLILSLGEVRELAEVTVNGRTFDALWHPPFEVDITDAVRGDTLEIAICGANLWANRMIGDDRLCAPDCEWVPTAYGPQQFGIKELPAWVKKGLSSPTGRVTFETWRHWNKDHALLPSGILGPVELIVRGEGR